jgi:Fic family protein
MTESSTTGGAGTGLALTWEEWPWESRSADVPMSRSQRATIRPTYLAAVPAEISGLRFDIEPSAAALIDDARAEIARFDAELSATFPAIEFTPLAAVLLRTESASSSQIENIAAGAKSLALAELGFVRHGSNAGLVAANVDAMRRALELADTVTPATILAVHEALMRGQQLAGPGEFRTEQVWVGGSAVSPHAAAFVPPHHSRVESAIDDLVAFAKRTDLPLIAQVAIAHAQFETIHPFNDGNGRTGRALVHAMLKHGGATTRTTVPVSAGLLADTESYFAALTAYRAGDPNPIVERFGEAAFAAVRNGRALASDLADIYQQWSQALTARKNAAAWRVLPLLLSQPALTSSVLQQAIGLSQPAADNAIRQLRDVGIVTKASGVQRGVVWVADDVTRALDAFGERARRG